MTGEGFSEYKYPHPPQPGLHHVLPVYLTMSINESDIKSSIIMTGESLSRYKYPQTTHPPQPGIHHVLPVYLDVSKGLGIQLARNGNIGICDS